MSQIMLTVSPEDTQASIEGSLLIELEDPAEVVDKTWRYVRTHRALAIETVAIRLRPPLKVKRKNAGVAAAVRLLRKLDRRSPGKGAREAA